MCIVYLHNGDYTMKSSQHTDQFGLLKKVINLSYNIIPHYPEDLIK